MPKLRFFPGNLVWLWSTVIKKSVAPKFYELWTGPYKVTKKLSDITYEIQDETKKKTKNVHFDRLKKATFNPVKLYQFDGKEMPECSTKSDSDIEHMASRTRDAPNRVKTVKAVASADTTDAKVKRADKPASPKHQAVAPLITSSNCRRNYPSIGCSGASP